MKKKLLRFCTYERMITNIGANELKHSQYSFT